MEPSGMQPSDASLEREKFDFDQKLRLEELKLKQAEATRLDKEFKIKEQESQRSRWTNPLVVAIIGATAVGLGNVGVAIYNAKKQRAFSDDTNSNLAKLENIRAENTSVLEVIKLADAEKVRMGLCRLVKLNSIKTPNTNAAIQTYLAAHKGCDPDSEIPVATSNPTPAPSRSDWQTATLVVPGCGTTGCYQNFSVCGSAPTNTKPTGAIRNSVDSFGGAWGDWSGSPTVSSTQVCRTFTQHSHNVTRTVSFQFEVVPTS